MAATMANDRVMSGTGERAKEKTPAVVTAINPAVNPTSASNARRPIQYVPATRPHAARAINHAWSGGLLSMGVPLISGSSQCPRARISRAIIGNRVSSLVANTCAPKSKNSSAALNAINTTTPARRSDRPTNARQRSGPALIRQVVITPGVEHQEGPEDLSMIPMARKVLADGPRYRGGLEQASTRDASRGEPLLENVPERPAQPRRNRNPEALFPPGDDGARKEVIDRALEEILRRPGTDLEPGRDSAGQLDQRGVEERRSDLEGSRHGRAVRRDQRLVREIEAAMLINHALEGVPERGVLDRPRQLGIWIKGV